MALSTLSRIRPRERHVVYPPGVLVPLSRRLFEGFFDVAEGGPAEIVISHLGLRHLLPGMLRGQKYYSPFYWILRETRSKLTVKDKINDLGFLVATATTLLSRSSRQYVHEYQGFMEMQGLRPFRDVAVEEYLSEAQKDFDVIHSRALETFGSEGSRHRTVVFPSGSAHQIMPPQLAAKVLSHADFAFHEKDDFAKEFEEAGVGVVRFSSAEQICELIASASTVFCTDSFPSHLAQMWKEKALLLMTQRKAAMVVHPSFPRLRVIESRAECHPCRNLARIVPDHRCQAGRLFCATWEHPAYMAKLMKEASGAIVK
jgi:hypothetical protein